MKATTIILALATLAILCGLAGSLEASCSLSCAASTVGYFANESIKVR